jgi:hypothetical protein
MANIEKSRVAGTRPDGSKIILPETETRIRHARTGVEYISEEQARADIESLETDTTEDDICRDTTLRVLKGVDSTGGAG